MAWNILCDFDGTIATEDVTDSLLTRFADPSWQEIEAEWKAGHIGSRECMTRQVALMRGTPDEIDRHLDGIALDRHFAGFVRLCRTYDVPLTVVSDGLDYAIRALLTREGLDDLPVVANHLERVGTDRYRLRSPHAGSACLSASGTCKCAVTEPTGDTETLLIGDGASDFCAAGFVDLVFAKQSLLEHCRKRGIAHVPCSNFADAQTLLAALVEERVERPARPRLRVVEDRIL
jgi:2-hydroxy-3-keto-5-methylthiopentenyl-1-phosphate phosphatase